ncbi:hypothetical protein HN51_065138 [Arachis hypogaea]|uniref:uncharacterized protein LOC110270515 n=1 Tax=Arachis ipaensis TaxID=130454 RepID=UPI000A2AF4B5|nr:uncharacterized protein LOC110270515 [Arachis ipaensis]QHO06249.1 uncharacterized protein DS421_14g453100 [Arachis hypogaea]
MEKEKTKMKIKRKRAREEENESETKKIAKKRDCVTKTKEKEKEKKMEKEKAKTKENKGKTKEVVVITKIVKEKGKKNNNNCLTLSSSSSSSSKKLSSLGVFDFPWLKDGVMSKSEECNFLDCGEDSFLLSSSCFSEASTMASVLPDEEKLIMQDLWQPFESDDGLELNLDASNDDLNCIWSSLLSNPL